MMRQLMDGTGRVVTEHGSWRACNPGAAFGEPGVQQLDVMGEGHSPLLVAHADYCQQAVVPLDHAPVPAERFGDHPVGAAGVGYD